MSDKMKILIIRPFYGVNINGDMGGDLGIVDYRNWFTPDLSMLYAASLLEAEGHELDVLDANSLRWLPDKMFAELPRKEYDYVFLKMTIPSVHMDIKAAEALKTLYPSAKLVVVGHAVKLIDRWMELNCPFIDVRLHEPLEDYVFTLCHGADAKVSIDEFPTINYQLFPYQAYRDEKGEPIAFLWASRGCKYTCSYCPYIAFYGRSIDERAIDKVMADLKAVKDLGINVVQFRDPFFTANRERTIELCKEIIRQDLGMEFYIETRIDSMDREMIEWLQKAGCTAVFFGVESADQALLKKYKRPVYHPEKAKAIIEILREFNIQSLAFYIIGFPEETWEQIEDTYKLAVDLNSSYAQFNRFTPYPDTVNFLEFYEEEAVARVTPDLFVPFENRMHVKTTEHLLPDDVENMARRLTFMYRMNQEGLGNAFRVERYGDLQELRGRRQIQHYLKNSEQWWALQP